MARKARFNLPGIAKGVFLFWGVDALQPDAVLVLSRTVMLSPSVTLPVGCRQIGKSLCTRC